jgi:hypothetical protein
MNRFVGYIVSDKNGRVLHYANKKQFCEQFCEQTGIEKSEIRQAFVKRPFDEVLPKYQSTGTNIYEPNAQGLLVEIKKEQNELRS